MILNYYNLCTETFYIRTYRMIYTTLHFNKEKMCLCNLNINCSIKLHKITSFNQNKQLVSVKSLRTTAFCMYQRILVKACYVSVC